MLERGAGKVKVWDELNAEEGDAALMDVVVGSRPEDYAKSYAKNDGDGQLDGIYENGHPIMVRLPDGSLYRCELSVEYAPVFRSRESKLEHVCTKDDPWTKDKSPCARHPDAECVFDGGWEQEYERHECPHCGLLFKVIIVK